jgi:lipoprotein-releasing system permease protein
MKTWLPFEWIAAVRFLAEGRMQTAFIVVAASVGVAVVVFLSAMLAGLQGNMMRRTLLAQPHIVVTPAEEVARPLRTGGEDAIVQKRTQLLISIDQWLKVVGEIREMPGVRVATPVVSGPAFAVRGEATKSVSVTGIDPVEFSRIVPLPGHIVAGSWRLASTDAIVGIQFASDMGVGVGDKLRLATPQLTQAILTITGVFDLGSRGANERNVYVLTRTAQDLLRLPGGASAIDVSLDDVWAAERIAQRMSTRVGLQAESWIHSNSQLFSALNAQTYSNVALRIAVAFSVALGIASVLVVSVVQRSREIGILRAMGASRGQVMRVFLIQGGLVGLVGSFAGTAIAMVFLQMWQNMLKNPDGTPFFMVPFDPALVAWSAGIATLTGLMAAVTPARRASRLDPADAIRG